MKRMLSLDSLIAVRLPGDGNKLLLATSRPLMSVFFLRYLSSSSLSSSSSTSYRWLPDYKTLPDTSHPHQHPCHQQKQYYLSLLTKLLHSLPSPHKSARPVRKKLMSIGGDSSPGKLRWRFCIVGRLKRLEQQLRIIQGRLKLSERPSDNYLWNQLGADTGKDLTIHWGIFFSLSLIIRRQPIQCWTTQLVFITPFVCVKIVGTSKS